LLEACRDGYLVRPIVKNIPLKIDLRGVKKTAGDYDAGQIVQRITPFLIAIAKAIATEASNRKTVIFTPSVDTAKILADALLDQGIDAGFVSGACPDREEKIASFHKKGMGSAICNAMLLTEGWDCPDASCVCVLRPTKIRALFTQCVGRATRTLPGVIDGLNTREERLAAIAASAKPDMLIIDFLWLTDKMDLVMPVDLVAVKPEIREQMLKNGISDLLESESHAERDLLKSLEKAAKQHARKQARTIDPLAYAVSLGDAALAGWQPETKWDMDPATPGQLDFLRKQGMDITNIKHKGLASKIINRVLGRMKMGLASPRQLDFMLRLGFKESDVATLSAKQATELIDSKIHKPAAELVLTSGSPTPT
jgi:type I site-specific restriction endonuclease